MIGILVTWVTNHPLLALATMTGAAGLVGYATIRPNVSQLFHQNHPRC